MSEGRSSVFHGWPRALIFCFSRYELWYVHNWTSSLCLVGNLPSLVPLSTRVKMKPSVVMDMTRPFIQTATTEAIQPLSYVFLTNDRRVKPKTYPAWLLFFIYICALAQETLFSTFYNDCTIHKPEGNKSQSSEMPVDKNRIQCSRLCADVRKRWSRSWNYPSVNRSPSVSMRYGPTEIRHSLCSHH